MSKLTVSEVGFWLNEIEACEKKKQAELCQRNNYPFLVEYYEGSAGRKGFNDKTPKERQVFINEYFPNVNSLISDILFTAPEITVEPRKPEAEAEAPTMQGALSYAFDRLDALTENRIALFDCLFCGFMAVEVNHINLPEQEKADVTGRTLVPQPEKETKSLSGANSEESAEEEQAKSTPPKEFNYATTDETYLRRWSPLDVIRDYRADRDKDERFRGKIIRMTHAEFAAMYPKFKDKVYPSGDVPYSEQLDDTDRKTITLYELQIKRGKNEYVNVVLSPSYRLGEIDFWERPYTTNGFNMVIGTLHEYGKLFPISMAQVNKAIQDDINTYMQFMMETAERNIPKRGYTKGKVEVGGLTSLMNSTVNGLVECKGGADSVWTIPNTNVSQENKELLQVFQQQKEKLWAVSVSRLQGKADVKFATELQIQESGFQSRQADIQEGLRKFMVKQLDIVKDIIAQFWDGEYWFKVTGKEGVSWYAPRVDPQTGMVTNALADLLTGDYNVNVNIVSSARMNRFQRRKEIIEYLTWLFNPVMMQYLMSQGIQVNADVVKQSAKQFGFEPDTLFIAMSSPTGMPGEMAPESVSPELAAMAQGGAVV